MTPRRLLLVAIAIAMPAALLYAARLARSSVGAFGIGAAAPAFHAVTLEDQPAPRTIADYRGEVVLLNLWATWCGPCVVEMPSIERLHGRYAAKGLRVVAVAVDDPGFGQTIRDFTARLGLTFEILHEGSGDIERAYRSRGIPSTYLIGRDGRILMIRQGATDWDAPEHRAVVERLLAAPRS